MTQKLVLVYKHFNMKKLITLFLLLSAFSSNAQESFFRGNNNYQAPILFAPTISATIVVSNISRYGATSGATITNNGGAPILASGVCWSATTNTPTIADNKTTDGTSFGAFTSIFSGLTAGVTYNVRAYATNSVGTSYGAVQSFTTSVKTIQTAVLIGSQVWTDKNLNVANYRNGDLITYASNAAQWNAATNAGIGAWSYYNFDAANGLIFGKLYNWYAVNDSRGLAPAGYHVPTKLEYNTLATNSGSALKAASSEWGASMGTNSTGFTGLPGGNNNITGANGFEDKGTSGWFWTSDYDVSNPLKAYFRLLHISAGFVDVGSYSKTYGFSVRLVKDNNVIETVSATPALTTTTSSSISANSAVVGGTVTDEGNTQVSIRGFVYGTSAGSSTYSVTTGSGAGSFTNTLTGLTSGTTYFVRSFATNVQGTAYGAETSFTTMSTPTVSSTATVTSITGTTAVGGGTITSDGGATVTSRGLVWGTSSGSSTYSIAAGTGTGTFTTSISGLSIGTTYFVRAFATNSVGTSYGSEVSFATPNTATVASTITSTITSSTAILGGVLSSTGGATTSIGIMYSTSSNFGTYTTTTINANAAVGTSYTTTITGLAELTTYYAKSFATNTIGTTYGPTINFTTPAIPLSVGTNYQGGIIFYIFQSNDPGYVAGQTHGLISATTNQGNVTWHNGSAINTGATSTSIGSGLANTISIINYQGTGTSHAAGLARAYRGGGYSDWYLPSLDELNVMFVNRNIIGGFIASDYWSSSESLSSIIRAWEVDFINGWDSEPGKSNSMYVRAIRSF